MGTTYFVRAYATNSAGTAYGSEISFITTGYYHGHQGYGGVIFWVSSDANRALVAAKQDINPGQGTSWWPQGGPYPFIGATNNELGGGDFNTNLIANHPQCQLNAAVRLCFDVVIEGYDDWYVGNPTEMNQLYLRRNIVGLSGTFPSQITPMWNRYWTSKEESPTEPILSYFYSWGTGGGSGTDSKGGTGGIRPIRKVGNW